MRIITTAFLLFVSLAYSVFAVDLTTVDRLIGSEPTYATSTPRYALLVLGQQAESRVWIVVDGKTMYVDRNGNGDLTEPDEAVTSESGSSFKFESIRESASGVQHNDLYIKLYDPTRFRLSIDLAQGCKQTVGYGRSEYVKPRFAERAEDAPIIHLNGPMTFAPYGPVTFLPRSLEQRSYRSTWMRVFIGSPGLGEGTFAGYNCQAVRCDRSYRNVTADIKFTSRSAEKSTFTSRQQLEVKG